MTPPIPAAFLIGVFTNINNCTVHFCLATSNKIKRRLSDKYFKSILNQPFPLEFESFLLDLVHFFCWFCFAFVDYGHFMAVVLWNRHFPLSV